MSRADFSGREVVLIAAFLPGHIYHARAGLVDFDKCTLRLHSETAL
jgi:hypothetical protein